MTRFGRRGLIATVATAAVAVLAGATALAVTAHGTNHTNRRQAGVATHGQVIHAKPAPKAHHWSIAASGFAPDSLDNPTNDYFNNWDFARLANADNNRCFNASVHLPNGATIKSVTFFYTRGTTAGLTGELNRQNLPNHKFGILADFSVTATTTAKYTAKTIRVTGGGLVDTSRFAYGLGTCPRGDSAFSGAIITYTG
jgi:hypothetical protein